MTVEVREYTSEGHRLLLASSYSPAEIAKLAGLARQRVSEWRKGQKRPDAEARAALERAIGVPARSWDAAPQVRAPEATARAAVVGAPSALAAPPASSEALESGEGQDLAALGLPGLEALLARLRAVEPTLPPRERIQVMREQARVLAVHEQLRQRDADAREGFLRSPAFRDDVRTLVAALPGVTASALRGALSRLGIDLPEPAAAESVGQTEPPGSVEDLEELLDELGVAKTFRDRGEPALALAHTAALGLDVHAGAIAVLLVDHGDLAARLLDALEGPDARIVRAALEKRMALRDVQAFGAPERVAVAELLRQLGHADVAAEIAS